MINRNSRWIALKPGHDPRTITVVGIWALGGGEYYRPVAYELEDEQTKAVVIRSREKMLEMIQNGKLIREF